VPLNVKPQEQDENKNFAVNFAIFFWALALITQILSMPKLTLTFSVLVTAAFITHMKLFKSKPMFKKKTPEQASTINNLQDSEVGKDSIKKGVDTKKNNTTVIDKNVRIEGSITGSGHVYVYGELYGNIDARESLIKIMQGGVVTGNITCRELVVDGSVTGECEGNSIEIYEHGSIIGSLNYQALVVKKGGKIAGQAEAMPKMLEQNNAFDLLPEKSPYTPEENELPFNTGNSEHIMKTVDSDKLATDKSLSVMLSIS